MRKFAVFNRVVIDENDIYCINFETPLWFLEDDSGELIISNRYGISIHKDENLTKEMFYELVKSNVYAKYVAGHIPDATAYTKEEWEEHCKEIMGIKDEE